VTEMMTGVVAFLLLGSRAMAGKRPMRIRKGAWEENALVEGTIPNTSWPGEVPAIPAGTGARPMAGTRPAMTGGTMWP
jgi:hypothetical protein